MNKQKKSRYHEQWVQHNQWLRSRHLPTQSFPEYLDSLRLPKYQAPQRPLSVARSEPYRRGAGTQYPSATETWDPRNTALPETKVYTGTLVKGICQTHKSNAVPVIDQEQMIDIARMRR